MRNSQILSKHIRGVICILLVLLSFGTSKAKLMTDWGIVYDVRFNPNWPNNPGVNAAGEMPAPGNVLSHLPPGSLPVALKEDIGMIAHLCPFVGGNATLKARVLWQYWQPNVLWEDRVLCLQGQNKNGDINQIDPDSMYSSITQAENNLSLVPVSFNKINDKMDSLTRKDIQVYPNPASDYIVVSYKSATNGEFRLYNALGELILKTELSAINTKTHIPLLNLASGIYHFEAEFVGMLKTIGKITILK
ncbi:MAG: T9SS type A sorting domain-containing protein [Chitinophagaceae bacterium]|nr:T9SS type A sorting domain-containing protein [Chitinophagaceae bacterium]